MAGKKKTRRKTPVFTDKGVHDLAVGRAVAEQLRKKEPGYRNNLAASKEAARLMLSGTMAINKKSKAMVAAKKRAAKKKR